MTPLSCLSRGVGNVSPSVKSMHKDGTPSLSLRLPAGLNGFGSQKFLVCSGKLGTWQLVHAIALNLAAPLIMAARIAGSFGMTRPGTGKAAWNIVTAVTSARVNSFVKPSPSGSVSMPKRSVD